VRTLAPTASTRQIRLEEHAQEESEVTAAGFDRVVVGISGSLGNLAALHAAVTEARRSQSVLIAVLAWTPPGGETGYRRAPWKPLLDLCKEQAEATLEGAFADALGGRPADVQLTSVLIRGAPGSSLVGLAHRPSDLLVIGAGRHGRLARFRHGSVTRYCLAHARCPVLAVPQPEMINDLAQVRRRTNIASKTLDPHHPPAGLGTSPG
jgi:nucleotide-binding universal stress UspA family protein